MSLLMCLGWATPAEGQAPSAGSTPGRVVSLGGSVTETVAALGLASVLVGVDDSSVWPESVQSLPSVGYFRTLGAEGVLSLAPDLVLALEGSGPPGVLAQIRAAGVQIVEIPSDDSREGAVAKARQIGRVLGEPARGDSLASRIEADYRRAEALRAEAASTARGASRALFLWGRGGSTLMVGGSGTGAHAMMELAGLENAAAGVEGYKPMNTESLLVANPELLVVDRATLERIGGLPALRRIPGLAAAPAVREGRIVTVDVLPFLGFGPRSGAMLLDLMERVHGAGTLP